MEFGGGGSDGGKVSREPFSTAELKCYLSIFGSVGNYSGPKIAAFVANPCPSLVASILSHRSQLTSFQGNEW